MMVTSSVVHLSDRTPVDHLLLPPCYDDSWDLSTRNWPDNNRLAGGINCQQGDNVLFDDSPADRRLPIWGMDAGGAAE